MNDLDPLLHEAMARVRGPVDARPSVTDVRRRARRHTRRRMTATVGVVACTGVATAALIIRRDSAGPSSVASAPADSLDGDVPTTTILGPYVGATTTYLPAALAPAELTVDATLVWDALSNLETDPTAVGLVVPPADVDRGEMPTAAMFGCTTDECSAMFNYIVWHELALGLDFFNIQQMQDLNPGIDFSQLPRDGDVLRTSSFFAVPPTTNPNDETPTTVSLFEGVVLIDGGAPAGAMEDAYQRLPGYNRTIVPSSGKSVEQTMVMPIGDNTELVTAVAAVFGIDGFDTWDPSFIGTPIQGMVAVVIGPDYFDRVAHVAATPSTTTTTLSPTTTSIVG